MPLDPALYTANHAAPEKKGRVSLVAYERRDGAWDVFVFEPAGICPPEWERLRVDRDHLHVATVAGPGLLDEVMRAVDARLDDSYDLAPAFHCPDPSRRGALGSRLNRLHKAGCTGYEVRHDPDGGETLWVRRRDLHVLAGPGPG